MAPNPRLPGAHQQDIYDGSDNLVQEIKTEGHDEARAGVFNIQPHAQGRSQKPDDGFGNPVQSNVVVAKCILDGTDESTGNQTRDRTAAGNGKVDGDSKGRSKTMRNRSRIGK